jgi:hypothetical protein
MTNDNRVSGNLQGEIDIEGVFVQVIRLSGCGRAGLRINEFRWWDRGVLYMHGLPIVGFPTKISVRIEVLSYLLMAIVLLSVSCLPTTGESYRGSQEFSEKDVKKWRTKEVLVLASEDSSTLERRIFSVNLPLDWDIRHARPLPNSWSGQLVGPEFTLDFQGGPNAVSFLDEIIGRGSVQLNDEIAAIHLVAEAENAENEEVNISTVVRPKDGGNGVTGVIVNIEGTQLLIAGRDMSANQQAIAFAIFRSIVP